MLVCINLKGILRIAGCELILERVMWPEAHLHLSFCPTSQDLEPLEAQEIVLTTKKIFLGFGRSLLFFFRITLSANDILVNDWPHRRWALKTTMKLEFSIVIAKVNISLLQLLSTNWPHCQSHHLLLGTTNDAWWWWRETNPCLVYLAFLCVLLLF